jgi:hypothetical protein
MRAPHRAFGRQRPRHPQLQFQPRPREPWGEGESQCPWEPRNERELERERDTGVSICRADSKEATPLVVLMLFGVYHARRLFFFLWLSPPRWWQFLMYHVTV